MSGRRVWCFLVHRWFVPSVVLMPPPYGPDFYLCRRCGEGWGRP